MNELWQANSTRSRTGHTSGAWRRSRGFTIIELLIVMAVILTLSAVVIPSLQSALNQARYARALSEVHMIGNEALAYQAQYGSLPNTLTDVGYSTLKDPWGRPYQYFNDSTSTGNGIMLKDRFGVPINRYFDLYSLGKDGVTATSLSDPKSQDNIIWGSDGAFLGYGANF